MAKKQTKADRQKIANDVQASSALEGYEPLSPNDGVPYQLQQQWIEGEITMQERRKRLMEHYGLNE